MKVSPGVLTRHAPCLSFLAEPMTSCRLSIQTGTFELRQVQRLRTGFDAGWQTPCDVVEGTLELPEVGHFARLAHQGRCSDRASVLGHALRRSVSLKTKKSRSVQTFKIRRHLPPYLF